MNWTKSDSFDSAVNIIKILKDNNFIAVFAGGCVRDTLLNVTPKDYDIATSALLSDILKLFTDVNPVGKAFGVYLVNGHEVSTFRTENSYLDGRHPDTVTFVLSLEEDSKRRDFTINAIYYDPIENKYYDFHNGLQDLKDKIIRFVGVAYDRILEDKLRMLRAVRFYLRFNYIFDIDTAKSIKDNANKINSISPERVGLELNKIFEQSKCHKFRILETLKQLNLLFELIPEFKDMYGCEQPKQFHPEGDVAKHTERVIYYLPEDCSAILIWAAILHDIGKPIVKEWDNKDIRWRFNKHDIQSALMSKEILKRFNYSNSFIDKVYSLVLNHMKFQHVTKMRESKLKRFLSLSNFNDHLDLHKADCLGSHGNLDNLYFCINKIKEFTGKETTTLELPCRLVTGDDLINYGMIPGPRMKPILEKAYNLQLEGHSREKILEIITVNLRYS